MSKKLNIIPHSYKVGREGRNKSNGHPSFVMWFVGLSGSGKSTLANVVEQRLFERNFHTYTLDGDNVRSGLNKDLDFSDDSRKENIRRIGELSNLMVDAGLITISAFISPFEKERELVKSIVGEANYIEIFVDCPLEICEERDVKGLYKKARKGEIKNFTGISSPFEKPKNPDLAIPSAELTIEEGVDKIMTFLDNRLKTNF